MKSSLKRILPILLAILVLLSAVWYLFVYDRAFTRDLLPGVTLQGHGLRALLAHTDPVALSGGGHRYSLRFRLHGKRNGIKAQQTPLFRSAVADAADDRCGNAAALGIGHISQPAFRAAGKLPAQQMLNCFRFQKDSIGKILRRLLPRAFH